MRERRLLDSSEASDQSEEKPAANALPHALLDAKIQELVLLIGQSDVDTIKSREYQQRISEAFRKSAFTQKELASFKALDEDENLSREDLLEGLEKLLSENKFDSKLSTRYVRQRFLHKLIYSTLAVLLILTGFAMIIMPAPPSFEIFTVYYFTANDGVTVMDLVSLLIIFGGVLLFVLTLGKK